MIWAFISETVSTGIRGETFLEEIADLGKTLCTFFVEVELHSFVVTFVILDDDTTLIEVNEGVVDKLRRNHQLSITGRP
jgi:hypothetical protein